MEEWLGRSLARLGVSCRSATGIARAIRVSEDGQTTPYRHHSTALQGPASVSSGRTPRYPFSFSEPGAFLRYTWLHSERRVTSINNPHIEQTAICLESISIPGKLVEQPAYPCRQRTSLEALSTSCTSMLQPCNNVEITHAVNPPPTQSSRLSFSA